jgi:hypothetical protein
MSSLAHPVQPAIEPVSSAAANARLQPVAAPQGQAEDGTLPPVAWASTWVHEHWTVGIVGGLVLLEAIVFFVWLMDLVHFLFTGLAVADAWDLVLEKPSFERWTAGAEAAFVFVIFFLLLPAANAGLLSGLRKLAERNANRRKEKAIEGSLPAPPPSVLIQPRPSIRALVFRRLQRSLIHGGKTMLILHLFFSMAISAGTVLMEGMQILTGNSYGVGGLSASFFSVWLAVVSAVKWVTPAFFLPVARKYLVRMFGGEHPHFLEVLHEIFTEEGFRG